MSGFFEKILDSIRDLICVVDRERRLVFVNRAVAEFVGKSKDELIGKLCYKSIRGREKPCEHCATIEALQSGQPSSTYFTILKSDGTELYVEQFCFPVLDEAGNVRYAVEYNRDATEVRMLQLDSERRLRQLKRAYYELAEVQGQLLQAGKLATFGQMVSAIAHELDTPLTTIFGYCELLEERLSGEELEEVRTIRQQVERCKDFIRDILDFARKPEPGHQPHNIVDIIKKTLSLLEPQLKQRNIDIQTSWNERVPPVLANYNQLQQVFLNLLTNSIDAMKEGGSIFVRVHPSDANLVIDFEDTGPGIRKEELKEIFEPFHTTKPPGEGTGLGLTICRTIIRAHGGEIRAEEKDQPGALFRITLPALKETKS